ncbi:unnamed protein product [Spirodela intermedia]|uniref:Uncharacterized protein n=1 Tax=Spirodela intermedia TaxID=51605 RepID=A0A7I8IAS3_SPIIN|nr:unnamed protein product [Spirodela intermedia]CAA6654799.1 unnamed protein product [Spirodela intermedia]
MGSGSSPTRSSSSSCTTLVNDPGIAGGGNIDIPGNIPLEIVTEEEMALIDAAITSARSLILASSSLGPRALPLSSLHSTVASLRQCRSSFRSVSPPILTPGASSQDIEDSDQGLTQSKSPLKLFRSRRALSVTDVTATEWCEKQMEFVLLHGKPERTKAMKAGSERHVELEEEVMEKVEIRVISAEDSWAVRLMNFIFGSRQLLFDGLTRELPIIGIVEGIWMVGVIDEIRMPKNEAVQQPLLVDTKTRHTATLPSEAQKRNGRLQLMCYKYLWDNTVAHSFPSDEFYSYFGLDPHSTLSDDVRDYSARLGVHAKTLEDVVIYLGDNCRLLPPSQEKLMLRYEFQADRSLMEEYIFDYDEDWFKGRILGCLAFWSGEREASLVSKDEQWKCRFCKFYSICPVSGRSSNRLP